MAMMSYAQSHEDVILARVFTEPTGFYIDVGAAHPVFHSVTKHFSERGWTGVNVEPQPTFFGLVAQDRPRDVNINAAVSEADGECTFHEVTNSIGCSTLDPKLAEQMRANGAPVVSYTVKTVSLRQICERHVTGTIDFLKIDAEGHELSVLKSGDFSRWRPRAMVIETTAHETWDRYVLAQGYLFAFFDGLNRYYVRAEEDPRFIRRLAIPVSVVDDYKVFEYEHRIRELEHALALAHKAA